MIEDPIAPVREKYFEIAKELDEALQRSYRPEFDQCRRPEQFAKVHRAYMRDRHRTLEPIVRALAALPPPPLVISGDDLALLTSEERI